MKQTKKILGIMLAMLMCFTALSVGFVANADGKEFCDYKCVKMSLEKIDIDSAEEIDSAYSYCNRSYTSKSAYESDWNPSGVKEMVENFVVEEGCFSNVAEGYVIVGSVTKGSSTSPVVYTFLNGYMDSDGISTVDSTAIAVSNYAYALNVTCRDSHENANKVPGVDGNCIEPGYDFCYKCDDCGKYFTDKTCSNEIEDYDVWKTTDGLVYGDHAWVEEAANEPTCKDFGNEYYRHCTVCGRTENANEEVLELLPLIGLVDHKDDDKDGKCDWCGKDLSTPADDPTPAPASDSDYTCPLCNVATGSSFADSFLITLHSFVHIIWGILLSFGLVK